MTEYTPDTEEVRNDYRFSIKRPDICGKDFGFEFDRWLNEIRAEAWDEGYTTGFYDREILSGDSRDASEGRSENPYLFIEK